MNLSTNFLAIKFISVAVFLIAGHLTSFSQGTLLIIPDGNCSISVDGEVGEQLQKEVPKKITLSKGEHYLQFATEDGVSKSVVVNIEDGIQKIFKTNLFNTTDIKQLTAKGKLTPITVANLELSLTPLILKDEGNSSETFYYAFEKGDELMLNAKILNKKGNFFVRVRSYPDETLIYSNQKTGSIKNQMIKIPKRGIYILDFWTNAFFGKKIQLAIQRIPANQETVDFNTTVELKDKYEAITVISPTQQYVNSTSHEQFKGGSSEITAGIDLPPNTVEWHYIFTASRNKSEIAKVSKTFDLLGNLSKAILGANGKIVSIGIDAVTVPPGADYCDVFVLDRINQQSFVNNLQFSYIKSGTRQNLKQGKATIPVSQNSTSCFLGFRNRDYWHGIHVAYEVVAIVKSSYLEAVALVE